MRKCWKRGVSIPGTSADKSQCWQTSCSVPFTKSPLWCLFYFGGWWCYPGSPGASAILELTVQPRMTLTFNFSFSSIYLLSARITGVHYNAQLYATLGIKPRASFMLGKHSTDFVIFIKHFNTISYI